MERATVDVYERRAADWLARRPPRRVDAARDFAARVSPGEVRVDLTMKRGDYEGWELPGDDFPGRFFACWAPPDLADVVVGAGFVIDDFEADSEWIVVNGRRARTLPDTVGPRMRLLLCGLNP